MLEEGKENLLGILTCKLQGDKVKQKLTLIHTTAVSAPSKASLGQGDGFS
jgi:hypothetical protein